MILMIFLDGQWIPNRKTGISSSTTEDQHTQKSEESWILVSTIYFNFYVIPSLGWKLHANLLETVNVLNLEKQPTTIHPSIIYAVLYKNIELAMIVS